MAIAWLAVDLKGLAGYQVWKPEVTKLAVGDYLIPSWAPWTDRHNQTPEGLLALGQDETLTRVDGIRDAVFRSSVDSPQRTALRRFYYPGWEARTAQGASLPIRPAPSTGLIQVEVPAGEQEIHLTLPWGTSEKIGLWISALSAGIIAFLFFRSRRHVSRSPH